MIHCCKFNADDIWFLFDLPDFERRELRIGICPKCQHKVAELIETRKTDGKVFYQVATRRKAERLIAQEKVRVLYTAQDVNRNNYKKKLSGGCMGLIQQSRRARRY